MSCLINIGTNKGNLQNVFIEDIDYEDLTGANVFAYAKRELGGDNLSIHGWCESFQMSFTKFYKTFFPDNLKIPKMYLDVMDERIAGQKKKFIISVPRVSMTMPITVLENAVNLNKGKTVKIVFYRLATRDYILTQLDNIGVPVEIIDQGEHHITLRKKINGNQESNS